MTDFKLRPAAYGTAHKDTARPFTVTAIIAQALRPWQAFLSYFTKKLLFQSLPVYFVKNTIEIQRTHDITHSKFLVVFHSFMLYW